MHRFSSSQLQTAGFTLVEMIVSLALFTVVVTISVGSLLVLITANSQLQDEQNILANLSFSLDSMTREIRTGTNFFCGSAGGRNANVSSGSNGIGLQRMFRDGFVLALTNSAGTPVYLDCPDGSTNNFHGLSFKEGGDSITADATNNRIAYFFNFDTSENRGTIYRRVSGEDAEPIVSEGVNILYADFTMTGSAPHLSTSDDYQPSVTIYIEAQAAGQPDAKIHRLQTTVSQRSLDL